MLKLKIRMLNCVLHDDLYEFSTYDLKFLDFDFVCLVLHINIYKPYCLTAVSEHFTSVVEYNTIESKIGVTK